MNPKQAIYAPYVIQDREKIGRRIVDVEAVQRGIAGDIIECIGWKINGLVTGELRVGRGLTGGGKVRSTEWHTNVVETIVCV